MLDTVSKLNDLLNPRERRQAILLLIIMLLVGLVEMAGVASIFPLIAVLSNPDSINNNPIVQRAYHLFGAPDINTFFIIMSSAVFVTILLRTSLTAASSYGLLHFAQMRSHRLGSSLLTSYLRRPYTFFLGRHSSDMGTAVLSEVDQVIGSSLMPALRIASQTIVACFIMAVVVAVDPMVAVFAIVSIVTAYSAVYLAIRNFVRRRGGERLTANTQRYRVAQEVLAGVKEVKVGGLERGYLARYAQASFRFSRLQTQLELVREMPRHALELIAVGGILSLIIVLLFRANGDFNSALPTIAVYAFAGLRLLPIIQTLYQSAVTLRFGGAALDALHRDLFSTDVAVDLTAAAPLPLTKEIELRNVSFAYPASERQAVEDLSLVIPKHSTVGLVGATGAGKSTVVDIVLGLLHPQTGSVFVDGVQLDGGNARSWQRSIGYVPQQIFLSDESVAANIAFGLATKDIDMQAVERAARIANIHEFVVDELPLGYDTKVGDRGVRLSGGQRQRIGIARALYNDPEVVLLDEATSALDNITEEAVMSSMSTLSGKKTVIMIAHRLTTVKQCDQIVLLSRGKVADIGKFDELVGKHPMFRSGI